MCCAKVRSACRIEIRSLVKPLDQVTCLLKFNRKEESRRDIYAPQYGVAGRTRLLAFSDLITPERQATRVRFPVKKIEVVLPHEEIGLVNWIRTAACVV